MDTFVYQNLKSGITLEPFWPGPHKHVMHIQFKNFT